MSHLVIIDGHAIAHRAYHSMPSLSVDGQPVNAIYGFYSMILTAAEILQPNYLIVCLDSPGPNFRNEEFLGYRAKRKPADPSLKSQLPKLPETLTKAGISAYAMGGFEADDLIATIATKSLKRVLVNRKTGRKKPLISKITVITGDKDLMQLVNDRLSLFVPIRGLSQTKLFGPSEVEEKLGVEPSQVIDLKALMGDMSDNYPGVSGIGPKMAITLLKKFRNLDNIYSRISEINETTRLKLEKDKENAYLSQKLATLVHNIPLKISFKKARWDEKSFAKLLPLFQEYNFKSLVARVQKKQPKITGTKSKNTSNPNQESLF